MQKEHIYTRPDSHGVNVTGYESPLGLTGNLLSELNLLVSSVKSPVASRSTAHAQGDTQDISPRHGSWLKPRAKGAVQGFQGLPLWPTGHSGSGA